MKTPKTASTRVQLPHAASGTEPPAAEPGTLSFASDTELVRVQTSTGWEDLSGGSGGTVADVDSPDGSITVTDPTGPIVTLEIDPADLTAAGQMTGPLTATKVVGITETSGPTALTIGAISDNQILARSGSTLISGPRNSGSGILNTQPLGTPSSQSDEFNSGSSDLAARGWTCINAVSGATMTRVGDISNTIAASSLAATQYRSTITPSGICIQCSNEMFVYKTFSAPARVVTCGGLSVTPVNSAVYIRPNVIANSTLPMWTTSPNAQSMYVAIILSGGVYSCRARSQNGTTDNPNGWAVNDAFLDTFQQTLFSLTQPQSTQPYAARSTLERWLQGAAGGASSVPPALSRFGFACMTNTGVAVYTPFAFMRYVRLYPVTSAPPLI